MIGLNILRIDFTHGFQYDLLVGDDLGDTPNLLEGMFIKIL